MPERSRWPWEPKLAAIQIKSKPSQVIKGNDDRTAALAGIDQRSITPFFSETGFF